MGEISPDGGARMDPAAGRAVFECSSDPESIVIDVVEALATVAGVDPLEFEPRLYEVVDPDALARIVASGGAGTSVTFDLDRYRVTVDGAGEVVVREP